MTTATVAEKAAQLIAIGPDAVTVDLPLTVLAYLARKYVATEHRNREREHARRLEAETRAALRTKAAPQKRRTSAEVLAAHLRDARREAWALVLGSGFALPGGAWATWGEATVAQHEARIAEQRELVEGIEQDIALHESAIADLREFGVERLEDL